MNDLKYFEEIITKVKPDNSIEASKSDILGYLGDFFKSKAYTLFQSGERKENKVRDYFSCNDLWLDVLDNKISPGKLVNLMNFNISEWLPLSPGKYFTSKAKQSREEAEGLMNDWKLEYLPNGKLRMIEGGIGCLRLAPINGSCFFGASEKGVCHQGFPLLVSKNFRNAYLDEIKTYGYVLGDILGSIEILPPNISRFNYGEMPRYALSVEKFLPRKSEKKQISVTIAVLYSEGESNFDEKKKYTFAQFFLDSKEQNLASAVNWIEDYAHRYSYQKENIFFLQILMNKKNILFHQLNGS
jgi:hypothetical protein